MSDTKKTSNIAALNDNAGTQIKFIAIASGAGLVALSAVLSVVALLIAVAYGSVIGFNWAAERIIYFFYTGEYAGSATTILTAASLLIFYISALIVWADRMATAKEKEKKEKKEAARKKAEEISKQQIGEVRKQNRLNIIRDGKDATSVYAYLRQLFADYRDGVVYHNEMLDEMRAQKIRIEWY